VFVLAALFRRFAAERTASSWQEDVLPALHTWILGRA